MLRYNINQIYEILKKLELEMQNKVIMHRYRLEMLEIDLLLSEEFEKVSDIHERLFNIYHKFSTKFKFQILLSLTSNFSALMINSYFIYSAYLFRSLDVSTNKLGVIQILSSICIIARIIDIYSLLRNTSKVNSIEEQCFEIVSGLYTFKSEVRLKQCVRHILIFLCILKLFYLARVCQF